MLSMDVSLIRMTSAFNSLYFVTTNFPRLGDPISSSPSMINLIFAERVGAYHHFQCLYMHVKLAFIISGTTGKDFSIFYHRFKRVRCATVPADPRAAHHNGHKPKR